MINSYSYKNLLRIQPETDQTVETGSNLAAGAAEKKHRNPFKKRLDLVTLVRKQDIKSAKHAKINKKKVNKMLRLQKIPSIIELIQDSVLHIYFLFTFIYSIVQFAIKQDSFTYNIVCIVVSFNGLVVGSLILAYTLYKQCKWCTKKRRACRIEPHAQSVNDGKDKGAGNSLGHNGNKRYRTRCRKSTL